MWYNKSITQQKMHPPPPKTAPKPSAVEMPNVVQIERRVVISKNETDVLSTLPPRLYEAMLGNRLVFKTTTSGGGLPIANWCNENCTGTVVIIKSDGFTVLAFEKEEDAALLKGTFEGRSVNELITNKMMRY